MSKTTSFSRKQRRSQMREAGMLRVKNMYGFFSEQRQAWYKKMREDGIEAHEAHQKRVMDSIEEQLETKLNSQKETWIKMGYNTEEIEMLAEASALLNVKYRETRREDKKNARQLMKDAKASLLSR